jgi:hypothetical protein
MMTSLSLIWEGQAASDEPANDVHAGKGYEVVRYHSLMVDPDSLPAQLLPVAWTEGGHHAVQLGRDVGSPLAAAPC